jgi:AraC-like DNA-binding protein
MTAQAHALNRGRVVRGTADARLRSLLARGYVGFVETSPEPGLRLIPPTATVTLIINLGEPFTGLPDAFVAGMEVTASVLERRAGTECIDVKLTPPGAFTLFGGLPLHGLTGRAVDIREVLGPAAGESLDALREAVSWQRRFDLVDQLLLERAAIGPQPSQEIFWAWQQLVQTSGAVRIGDLAGQTGWSRRHFIARCRQQLGLPPKTLARILQFKRLLADLDAVRHGSWSDLAEEHGYYDQPHLVRAFHDFTGMAPRDFVAREMRGEYGDSAAVTFVQDVLTRRSYSWSVR